MVKHNSGHKRYSHGNGVIAFHHIAIFVKIHIRSKVSHISDDRLFKHTNPDGIIRKHVHINGIHKGDIVYFPVFILKCEIL